MHITYIRTIIIVQQKSVIRTLLYGKVGLKMYMKKMQSHRIAAAAGGLDWVYTNEKKP